LAYLIIHGPEAIPGCIITGFIVFNFTIKPIKKRTCIEQINQQKGKKHKAKYEAETIIELMLNGGAGMVFHGMSEDDVKRIMQYPFNMFASDAGIREYGQGVPHPRGYGTNARVLGKYVRDEKIISLEEAVRRMTSLPAQKFTLKDRGLLKEGMAADIVIFDEKEVADISTFDKPHAYSKGFKYVLVNGEVVVEDGKHTGVRSGTILKGPGFDKIHRINYD
jgi:N-acyl-D-amino-acid deacylase